MVDRIKKNIYEFLDSIRNFLRYFSKKPQLEDLELLRDLERLNYNNKSISKEWLNFQRSVVLDFQSNKPHSFLNFEIIKRTMFFNPSVNELDALINSKSWSLIKRGIQESYLGSPNRFIYYPKSSGNLIHHGYSLIQLERFLDLTELSLNSIVFEFGGGYGSFRRLIYNLGFTGQYHIYDIPIFLRIQKWYLDQVIKSNHNTSFYSTTGQLEKKLNPDVFVALWSLSESPIELRKKVEHVIKNSKFVLIAFQKSFAGIDNMEYFESLTKKNTVTNAEIYSIKHLPNNYYLIAKNDRS